jgi:hypothetical protein
MEKMLEVGVGMSRKWDPKEAADEVVTSTLEKLEHKPKFFLLFSTIHFDSKKGEIDKFVKCVYDQLPKDTPMVGGTLAGFMNNYGCYTRGATGFALYQKDLEVVSAIGHKVKKNPEKASRKFVDELKKKSENWGQENKVLINLISAGIIPKVPFFGQVNNIKSKILGSFVSHFGLKLASYLGTGVGKEEVVMDEISRLLPDYYILGGTCVDGFRYLSNYQFYQDKVYTNSIVGLGCLTKSPIYLSGKMGVHPTNKRFDITKTAYEDWVITKIENKPAKEYFFKNVLDLSEEQFGDLDLFYYKTSDYYPLGFDEIEGYSSGTGAILGNNIMLGYKAKGKKGRLLTVSGKGIVKSVEELLGDAKEKNIPFMLAFSSGIRLNILGNKCFLIKDILDKWVGDVPYLIAYTTNSNIGFPKKPAVTGVYSIDMMSFKN